MKTYIGLLFLSLVFLLSSCGEEQEVTKKYYQTGAVQSGSLSLQKTYIGYVEGEQTIQLAPKLGGKILFLKALGERVSAGERIAKVDANEAGVGYNSAQGIVGNLESLKTQTALMFDAQIASMQAKVEQAQSGNSGMQTGLQDAKSITQQQIQTAQSAVHQAKLGLETAQTNLEESELTLETKKNQIYNNTKNAISRSVILYTNIIDFSDSLLGVTEKNKEKNDSFEDYFGVRDRIFLNNTKQEFYKTHRLFLEYKTLYEANIENSQPQNKKIKQVAQVGSQLAEQLKVLLNDLYTCSDNSIANLAFPQQNIDQFKQQISQFIQDIESSLLSVSGEYLLGLKGSLENMENFSRESEMQVKLLKKQVELAESAFTTAQETLKQYSLMGTGRVHEVSTKKDISEQQVKEALAGLNALKKQKSSTLAEIESKITQARGEQNTAGVMIQNTHVISPIDGVVVQKLGEVGQISGSGMPVLVVADDTSLKVRIGVGDDIIRQLSVGEIVNMSIEGTPNQIQGKIQKIYPSKEALTKKNMVEIALDKQEKAQIKIGSMARVYLHGNSQNTPQKQSLIIPNTAIIQKFMSPGVYVLEDGVVHFQHIDILKQNTTSSAIQGLNLGDTIITQGKEHLYDGEILITH